MTPRTRLHLKPNLCPETDLRDAMSDEEFWEHVLHGLGADGIEDSPDDEPPDDLDVTMSQTVCAVCGSTGACGYDSEGRALIHADSGADDD